MLEIKDLIFCIEEKKILDNISFSIPEFEVTAIVGPNGVGKTTTVQILSNIIKNDNSSIKNLNARKKILYLDIEYLVFDELTAKEFIELNAKNNKKSRKEVATILNEFEGLNIKEFLFTKLKGLSLGQKQKLIILIAFMSNADVLIFDEPFNGLDYKSEKKLKDLLKENKFKFTIVITTHNFNNIEDYTKKCIVISDSKSIIQIENSNNQSYKKDIFNYLSLE
ncbi:ATP-binding cassette domain-containing protein [Bacillus wiedmannii]|uniref:ATP-binding cassette domain-containing protein n=1 Tax=Bacillus wiedmannii TaxID=1890302 RepID=UPI0006DB3355|nr:ABC transporter ATP-binding protein [Bacillus wiedmannii]KPU51133.1 ABC transporter family protein [Bacillus wiedmannii]PRT36525.1 ABC transporter ATP-binding protein [Bacillus wiedmannii]PRT47360.1 ABC transporter ATP-binding protein [Bacillus wiedmannii]